jgi:hypothetical protein
MMDKKEFDKKYDEKKSVVDSMTKEQRMERIEEISTELFIMANSFAGDNTGNVATYLHESVNSISSAQKIFKGEMKDEIPARFVLRSMGLYDEPMIEM